MIGMMWLVRRELRGSLPRRAFLNAGGGSTLWEFE